MPASNIPKMRSTRSRAPASTPVTPMPIAAAKLDRPRERATSRRASTPLTLLSVAVRMPPPAQTGNLARWPSSDLLTRSHPYRHPDPFRSVRDLGRAAARCSGESGELEGRSSAWLPAWLPAAYDVWPRHAGSQGSVLLGAGWLSGCGASVVGGEVSGGAAGLSGGGSGGRGWCEPGGGDVCHDDGDDHQRHDGQAV